MIRDRETAEAALREIFFEQPSDLDAFFTSALLDLRRSTSDEAMLVRDTPLTSATSLPGWLSSAVRLPPWEAALLAKLFLGNPLVKVQGGSGCGKTSTLTYLQTYCHQKMKEGAPPYFPHLLLVIDLQDFPDEIKLLREDREGQEDQARLFFEKLKENLDNQIQSSLTEEKALEVLNLAFGSPTVDEPPIGTTAATVRAHARKRKESQPPEKGNSFWDAFFSILSAGERLDDHVTARYIFLAELAETQKKRSGLRLALAIDNIDPFPEYLQDRFIRTIEGIQWGISKGKPARTTALSIALLTRLSTSTRQSGTLDAFHPLAVHFLAPDPADLVFYRLSCFLLAPDQVEGFTTLGRNDRVQVLGRSWQLWEQLVGSEDEFHRVFSGLSGTNLRTANKLARWWILSPRHRSIPSLPDAQTLQDLEDLRSVFASALLLRLAKATERSLSRIDSHVNSNELPQALADKVFSHMLGSLVDNRLVQRRMGAHLSTNDTRHRLTRHAGQLVVDILTLSRNAELRRALTTPLALAVFDLSDPVLRRAQYSGNLPVDTAKALREKEESERHRLDGLQEQDKTLAQKACAWLCSAVVEGVQARSRRDLEIGLDDPVHRLIRPAARSRRGPSRWAALSFLISPDSDRAPRSERTAANIFSADGEKLSPVGLYALAMLEETQNGLIGKDLLEHLQSLKFSYQEVVSAFRTMVEIDKRLVFSEVKDYHIGVERIFDKTHRIYISSSGGNYLERVARTPAYLQWALLEPRSLYEHLGGDSLGQRLETGIGRLSVVLEGLQAVTRDERRRRPRAFESGLAFRKSWSPSARVIFPGLWRFIVDLSHYGAGSGREASEVAKRFVMLGEEMVEDHRKFFGKTHRDFEEGLADAHRIFEDRFPENSALVENKTRD